MSKLYMGFDAGTQSVKVAVYDEAFKALSTHSLPTTLHYPHPGWVQMDVDEFLSITLECMKACVDDIRGKGYDPADIAAIMGDGIICVTSGGVKREIQKPIACSRRCLPVGFCKTTRTL